MKKVLLFPFNIDTKEIVENIHQIKDFQLVSLIGYEKDKEKLARFQENTKVICSTNFEECVRKVDIIIFADNTMGQGLNGYIDRVELSLKYGKEVYMSIVLLKKLELEEDAGNIHFLEDIIQINLLDKTKEISLPIVPIMGVGQNVGKFMLHTRVKRAIEKRGYKILSISSNPLGKLLGMKALPIFLFSDELSLPVKIVMFNLWLHELIKAEDYDLITIGYPGGIIPINEFELNHYGEIPLIIANAVIADEAILVVYKTFELNEEIIKKIKQLCEVKYNVIVENFIVSSGFYKINYEAKKVEYYIINEPSLISEEEINKNHIISANDKVGIENMVDMVLTKLENNLLTI